MGRNRLSFWQIMSLLLVALTILMVIGFIFIYLNPQSALNPFAPPTPTDVIIPSDTPSPAPTQPPTWTPTHTATVAPPATPLPTRTPTQRPTITPTFPPSPTPEPTETIEPTPAITRSPYPFTCNVIYRVPEYDGPWSGAAGYLQDLEGNPLPGYAVWVECPGVGGFGHQAGADERLNQFYGSTAAWEQGCNPGAYQAMEIRVQIYNNHPENDGSVRPVSDLISVNLVGSRSGSLGYIACTLNWPELQ